MMEGWRRHHQEGGGGVNEGGRDCGGDHYRTGSGSARRLAPRVRVRGFIFYSAATQMAEETFGDTRRPDGSDTAVTECRVQALLVLQTQHLSPVCCVLVFCFGRVLCHCVADLCVLTQRHVVGTAVRVNTINEY